MEDMPRVMFLPIMQPLVTAKEARILQSLNHLRPLAVALNLQRKLLVAELRQITIGSKLGRNTPKGRKDTEGHVPQQATQTYKLRMLIEVGVQSNEALHGHTCPGADGVPPFAAPGVLPTQSFCDRSYCSASCSKISLRPQAERVPLSLPESNQARTVSALKQSRRAASPTLRNRAISHILHQKPMNAFGKGGDYVKFGGLSLTECDKT
jgi:hypothetical protein